MIPPTGPFGSLQGAFQPKVRQELPGPAQIHPGSQGRAGVSMGFTSWSSWALTYSFIPQGTIALFQIYQKEKLLLITFRYIYKLFNYLYNDIVNLRSNVISSEIVCINERSCNNQDFKKWCSLLFTHFHNYLPAPARCRTLIWLSSWVIAGGEKCGELKAFLFRFHGVILYLSVGGSQYLVFAAKDWNQEWNFCRGDTFFLKLAHPLNDWICKLQFISGILHRLYGNQTVNSSLI